MSDTIAVGPRQGRAVRALAHPSTTLALLHAWPLAATLLVIAFLATHNLEHYPRIWFDEGMNLLAARNLAESGRYGLNSAEGFRFFDTSVQTGPTVIGPAAVMFKLFGEGVIQGRAVAVGYLLLAALGLYCVGRQLFGPTVATGAIVLFAAATQGGPFQHGRHLLGEVAALAFLFWGAAGLIWAQRAQHLPAHLGAGLLFGLAVITKSQFWLLLVLLLALVMLGLQSRRSFDLRASLLMLLASVIPVLLWQGFKLAVVGPTEFGVHLQQMLGQASVSSYVAPLSRSASSVNTLLSSGTFPIWGTAGLLYILLLAIRHQWWQQPYQLLLPAFAAVWLGWYIVFSMGWSRYAVPLILISTLFAAKLGSDLALRLSPFAGPRISRIRSGPALDPLAVGLWGGLAMMVLTGIVMNGAAIVRAKDDSPQRFAVLVEEQVEPGAVIESFEWEIAFLTDRDYHHPPVRLMDDATRVVLSGRPSAAVEGYQTPATASYLITGPFSKSAGLYRQDIEQGGMTKLGSAGGYDLYRRGPRP